MPKVTGAVALVVAWAALVVGATSEAAPAKVIHTDFFLQGRAEAQGPFGYEVSVLGRIDSAKRKCVHGRRVNLYFERHGERHLRDTGLSSRNGAIGLAARARAAPDRYIVKVTKKRVDRPRRPYICWRAHEAHKPFAF
jgi:hypothetical protein